MALTTAKLVEEISLELAIERSGLEILGPGKVIKCTPRYPTQISTVKHPEGERGHFICYCTNTRELAIYDLPDELVLDLKTLPRFVKDTNTFVYKGMVDGSDQSIVVKVASQEGLDLLLGLVKEQLLSESDWDYDHGLLALS